MKISTITASKKILGISQNTRKKAVERQPNEKIKQLREVRQEDAFQWKVRNNNFDHYNFLVTFRNISNFASCSFIQKYAFWLQLGFDQRCDPSA